MPEELTLIRLVIILITSQVLARILRLFGQPAVVGEMAAGFLLGPIVLGGIWPDAFAQLFSPAAKSGLMSFASLGVVLFMFIVGVELRLTRNESTHWGDSLTIGLTSVLIPMGLGIAIAPILFPTMAPAGLAFWPFALFVGTALSITAFPVLARILRDCGMDQSSVGRRTLNAAAVADVLSWVVLAAVIGLTGSARAHVPMSAIAMLAGVTLLCVILFFVVRPLCRAWLRASMRNGQLSLPAMAVLLIGLLICAESAQLLGLHSVFGAFLFGVSLPRDEDLIRALTSSLEVLAITILMPAFFALAGLSTTAAAFTEHSMILMVFVVGVAVVGKVAGGAIGSRMCGFNWKESFTTGTLLNARGLMELVVIKIGLDAGLITSELFTILLIMSLATTALTTPLSSLLINRGGTRNLAKVASGE